MSLDEATWGEIARLWRETGEPLGSIARRFAVAHQSISAMARRERWPVRPTATAPSKARHKQGRKRRIGGASASKVEQQPGLRTRARHAGRRPPEHEGSGHHTRHAGEQHAPRGSMVERLFQAMDTKLSAIEDRIACGEDATPADSERTTRAINTLVRSLEKLTEYEAKLSKTAGRRHGKRAGAGNDPERRRAELARRIQRLLDRR